MIHRDKPAPETDHLTHSQHRHEPLISIPPKSAFRSHQSVTPTARRLARRPCLVSPGTAPDRQVVDQAVGYLAIWAARLPGCTAHTRTPQPGAAVETRKVWDRRRIVRLFFPSFFLLHHLHPPIPCSFQTKHPFYLLLVDHYAGWGAFSRGLTGISGISALLEDGRRRTFAEAEADDVAPWRG